MQYYSITRALIKLYETLIDRRYQSMFDQHVVNNNELALYASIKVSCDNYGYENDGNTHHEDWERHSRYYLHFVIHKHHRVYFAVSGNYEPFHKLNEMSWLNIGNHDSCYRDSIEREVSKYYFQVHKEAWDHVPEEHHKAPVAADIDVSMYDVFGSLFEIVTVKRKELEDYSQSNDGYLDTITNIQKFSTKLVPGKQNEPDDSVRLQTLIDTGASVESEDKGYSIYSAHGKVVLETTEHDPRAAIDLYIESRKTK